MDATKMPDVNSNKYQALKADVVAFEQVMLMRSYWMFGAFMLWACCGIWLIPRIGFMYLVVAFGLGMCSGNMFEHAEEINEIITKYK